MLLLFGAQCSKCHSESLGIIYPANKGASLREGMKRVDKYTSSWSANIFQTLFMRFYARLMFVYCSYEFVVVELTSSAGAVLHGDAN
jgi:hypothetical protein